MKFTLVVVAVLAIIGLGQADEFPTQELPGKVPLRDDIQEILHLVPIKQIYKIAIDYLLHDSEVRTAFRYLRTTTIIKDFLVDFEAIPEVINFLNYLQKEGVDIYAVLNRVNKRFGIEKLVPPPIAYAQPAAIYRTGGLKGFFKDIMKQFHYDDYITVYVKKMKTSPAFVGFVNQLKSNNFQQIVNKVFEIKSFQLIAGSLKKSGVNLQIVADIMFIVLGINMPNQANYNYLERTLQEEFIDFWKLIPLDKYTKILITYYEQDRQIQEASHFMFTSEFHTLMRSLEALKEFQTLVIYTHKAGFNMTDYLQSMHITIGMEKYLPPKEIENIFRSEIGVQKVGGGMKAMIEDLHNILPLAAINDLYQEKLRTSKVYSQFVLKVKSPEMQEIIFKLTTNEICKEFNRRCTEKGLFFEDMIKLYLEMIGLGTML